MVVCGAVIVAFTLCFEQGVIPVAQPVDMAKAMTKWSTTDILPPEAYDRPYKGHTSIAIANSKEELQEKCNLTTAKMIACAWVDYKGTCTIVRRDDKFLEAMAMPVAWVLKHEMAHCNGWDKSHSGMRKPNKGDL